MIGGISDSLDGHIRAYSTVDGKLLWDMDTEKSFATVNGAPAKGGSLDGAGPMIAGGLVFVNSGYPRFGGEPGNVLLAFGVENADHKAMGACRRLPNVRLWRAP